jgi:hypothetical protein
VALVVAVVKRREAACITANIDTWVKLSSLRSTNA